MSLLGLYGTAPDQIQGGQTPWWLLFCWWHLQAVPRALRSRRWVLARGRRVLSRGPLRQKGQVVIWETWKAKGNHPSFGLKTREKEVGFPRERGLASEMRKCFLHFLKGGGKCFWSSQSSAFPVSVPECGVDVTLSCWRIWTDGTGPECLCASKPLEKALDLCLPRQGSRIFCFAVFSNLLPLMGPQMYWARTMGSFCLESFWVFHSVMRTAIEGHGLNL